MVDPEFVRLLLLSYEEVSLTEFLLCFCLIGLDYLFFESVGITIIVIILNDLTCL